MAVKIASTKARFFAILSIVLRLVAKSVLVRYKSGKKFFYKAVMSKDEMAADSLNTVCEQFFNGSRSDMIRFIERSVQDIVL